MYCTRTVRVTLTYMDTLTRGRVDGIPCIVHVLSEFRDTLTRGRGGGEGGNPRTVHVVSELLWSLCWTADLTWHYWTWMLGGGGEGGNPRTVHVVSELLWSLCWTADLTWHYWTWMLAS